MPYLGICRGMQILNVALGGSLDQHLAIEDGTTPHRRIVGTFEGNEHEIQLEPGSLPPGRSGRSATRAAATTTRRSSASATGLRRRAAPTASPGDRARRRRLGAGRPVASRGRREARAVPVVRGGRARWAARRVGKVLIWLLLVGEDEPVEQADPAPVPAPFDTDSLGPRPTRARRVASPALLVLLGGAQHAEREAARQLDRLDNLVALGPAGRLDALARLGDPLMVM